LPWQVRVLCEPRVSRRMRVYLMQAQLDLAEVLAMNTDLANFLAWLPIGGKISHGWEARPSLGLVALQSIRAAPIVGGMRFFATEDGPLRVLAEGVAGCPAIHWDKEGCLTEEELRATEQGRAALAAWRRGDDSVYEICEITDLALSEAEDELIAAGSEARPDLHAHLGTANSTDEIDSVMNELRKAGAKVLGLDR
jgi:hypothetical protein